MIYSDDSESEEYIESDEERDVYHYPGFLHSKHLSHGTEGRYVGKPKDTQKPLNGRSSSMYKIRGESKIDDSFCVKMSTEDVRIKKSDSTKTHSSSVNAVSASNVPPFKPSNILKTLLVYLPLKLAFLLFFILLAFVIYKLCTHVRFFIHNVHAQLYSILYLFLSLGFGGGYDIWDDRQTARLSRVFLSINTGGYSERKEKSCKVINS